MVYAIVHTAFSEYFQIRKLELVPLVHQNSRSETVLRIKLQFLNFTRQKKNDSMIVCINIPHTQYRRYNGIEEKKT